MRKSPLKSLTREVAVGWASCPSQSLGRRDAYPTPGVFIATFSAVRTFLIPETLDSTHFFP